MLACFSCCSSSRQDGLGSQSGAEEGPSHPNKGWVGIWKPILAIVFGAGVIVAAEIFSAGLATPFIIAVLVGSSVTGGLSIMWAVRDLCRRFGCCRPTHEQQVSPAPAQIVPQFTEALQLHQELEQLLEHAAWSGMKSLAEDNPHVMQGLKSLHSAMGTGFLKGADPHKVLKLASVLQYEMVRDAVLENPHEWLSLSIETIQQFERLSPRKLLASRQLTLQQLQQINARYLSGSPGKTYPLLSKTKCERVLGGQTTMAAIIGGTDVAEGETAET